MKSPNSQLSNPLERKKKRNVSQNLTKPKGLKTRRKNKNDLFNLDKIPPTFSLKERITRLRQEIGLLFQTIENSLLGVGMDEKGVDGMKKKFKTAVLWIKTMEGFIMSEYQNSHLEAKILSENNGKRRRKNRTNVSWLNNLFRPKGLCS